jgi:hypothetical protein
MRAITFNCKVLTNVGDVLEIQVQEPSMSLALSVVTGIYEGKGVPIEISLVQKADGVLMQGSQLTLRTPATAPHAGRR